jgi:CRP-like cAMP-binding protein
MERFKAGATVLSEGDEGAWMYVVASGTLTVSRNGKLIRKAGPGDFLGEIALIQKTKRGATVVADGDVVLLSLMRSDLEEVFKKDPQIETQFYKSMLENALEKVVELTDRIESARSST